MSQFFSNITKLTGLPFNEITSDFKVVYLGGGSVFISNYVKIIIYNTELIALKVKANVLNIEGKDLMIKQLSRGEIIVDGKINKIYLSKELS